MNKKIFLVISIILLSFITSIQPVKAVDEWEQVERGQDYIINHLKGTKTYSWESAPTWILDPQTEEYAPYVFDDKGTFYEVSTGLIGAEIHRGKAVFYSPDMNRMAVGRETWLVFQRQGVEWNPVCASLLPYFQTSYYTGSADFIEITGEWATQKGTLSIVYHFEERLKHTVTWTPNEPGIYAIVQFWNNTHYSDVTLGDGTKIIRTQDDVTIGKTDSLTFLFGNDTQPFGVFENQNSASDFLHKTIFAKGTVNYEGISITDGVAWIFFNSTLCTVNSGEKIEIDPDTSTLNDPTVDGYIRGQQEGYIKNIDSDYVYAAETSDTYRTWRGFVEWDTSGIPDEATITDTIFKYHGYKKDDGEDCHIHEMLGARPSTASDTSLWAECNEGTVYADPAGFVVVGTNQQVDLGTDADTDLQNQLTSGDWFAIGISRDYSGAPYGWNGIYSEEYVSTPDPTLYVEYTIPEEIKVQYYTVTDSRVNIDANVNIDVQLNYTTDGAPVIDGTVTINGISASHQGTGTWRITQSKSTAQGVNYNTVAASGNSRSCSDVDQNGQSQLEIWDRYNITSFWASDYNPQTGDNITLYAIFESEYDSHICDGDDSLTLEDLQFTYDPIEEYYFAEIGKDENGTYYFDTLNSIHENTYDITSGNLDYNLSVTWGNFEYDFYGPFYENGTSSGNTTIYIHFTDTIESFTLEGEANKTYTVRPLMVRWDLEGGASRVIYPISDNETYYIFEPFTDYGGYMFTIKDYSNVIGSQNSFLEAFEVINGTNRLIVRQLIWDTVNPTTLVLQKDATYEIQIRTLTGYIYNYGYFTPAVDTTRILLINEVEWGNQIHQVGADLIIEASRPSDNHIQVNYKDETAGTESIFIEICLRNNTQVWNATSTEQMIQFNWHNAVNTTGYIIKMTIEHELYGTCEYAVYIPGCKPDIPTFPDFDILGEGLTAAFGVLLIIVPLLVFSRAHMIFGMFCTNIMAYIVTYLEILVIPYAIIHVVMAFTIIWGLWEADRQ